MPEQVRRGFVPTDIREFSSESIQILRQAQGDIFFLLNRGYKIDRSIGFVGDHYQLSSRQRMALFRATASANSLKIRRDRERRGPLLGEELRIDGFNLIIPLEIALSNGTLLLCMDGVIRDLAGLHGTYRLIDKTDSAIHMIGTALTKRGIAEAEFYFDSPVSNAGRLAQRVKELLVEYPFTVIVRVEPHVDEILATQNNVVSGDSVILNICKSWINLMHDILYEEFPCYPLVDLSHPNL